MALSPILEAYFGGQQQQASLIGQAKELSDSALRRQQAQDELKQRQQTIDEIAKQHGVENDRSQKQLELQNRIAEQTHKYQMNEAASNMVKSLQDSDIAPNQFSNHLATLGVPGFSAPGNTADNTSSGLPQQAGPTVNLPNVNVPQANPMQTITLPSGDTVQVPAWKTSAEIEGAKKAADVAQAIKLFNATKEPEYIARDQLRQQQMDNMQQQNKDRIDELTRWHDMTGAFKDQANQAKLDAAGAKRFGYRTPEQYQQDIQNNVTGLATGQKQLSEIVDPQEKRDTQEAMAAKHYSVPDKGTIADINSNAIAASRALKVNSALANMVQGNDTASGKAANILRDLPIVSKINPTASSFNGLVQSEIAPLEKMQGLSLAKAGASVPFANMQKSITPYITDEPGVIAQKTANVADIALSNIAQKMSTLPDEHRKLLWHNIVHDNPDLLKNPYISPAVSKALQTGTYPVGGYLDRLVK